MADLHAWLLKQHPGLRTYKTFCQQAYQLADSDPDHRALYRLLAEMAERYIRTFDEEPLPTDVSEQAFQRLLQAVADAEASINAPIPTKIATLNRIAATELF